MKLSGWGRLPGSAPSALEKLPLLLAVPTPAYNNNPGGGCKRVFPSIAFLIGIPFRLRGPLATTSKFCLEALAKTEIDGELEIAFAINKDNHAAEAWLREKAPGILGPRFRITILQVEPSPWPIETIARARNRILEYARLQNFDALWFLDDDIAVKPQTLKVLLDADAPIVAGRYFLRMIRPVNLKPNKMILSPSTFKLGYHPLTGTVQVFKWDSGEIDIAGGGCILVKQPALGDRRLDFTVEDPQAPEDSNFCLKAKKAGYRIVVPEDAFTTHFSDSKNLPSEEQCLELAAANYALGQFYQRGFWFLFKKFRKGSLVMPDYVPPQLRGTSLVQVLQADACEFHVFSGFKTLKSEAEDQVEACLFTPYKPATISLTQLFTLYYAQVLDLLRKQVEKKK